MYWDSVLTSVIQVAIAIAGFSGIVAVLGQRSEGVWDEMDRIRLQGLLVGSFATMIIAFLPYILFSAELAESLVWRIASSIHAVGIGMDVVAKTRQHIASDIRFNRFRDSAVVYCCRNHCCSGRQHTVPGHRVAVPHRPGCEPVGVVRVVCAVVDGFARLALNPQPKPARPASLRATS